METITYSIPNISCQHCVARVTKALEGLSGVTDVEADLASKTIEVSFEAPATDPAIREVLREIDYPAEE